ncbi:hypothetical protein BC629DRAFT_731227 [Irpex lacteus]|nr:hypothetical protein BC629DRAFT_731227 [Irpex lacteus]
MECLLALGVRVGGSEDVASRKAPPAPRFTSSREADWRKGMLPILKCEQMRVASSEWASSVRVDGDWVVHSPRPIPHAEVAWPSSCLFLRTHPSPKTPNPLQYHLQYRLHEWNHDQRDYGGCRKMLSTCGKKGPKRTRAGLRSYVLPKSRHYEPTQKGEIRPGNLCSAVVEAVWTGDCDAVLGR